MDPARSAKESVIVIYETLYEQQKLLRRLNVAVPALLETIKELNGSASEVYAKHFAAQEQGPLAEQHDAALKDISELIGKLKASIPS